MRSLFSADRLLEKLCFIIPLSLLLIAALAHPLGLDQAAFFDWANSVNAGFFERFVYWHFEGVLCMLLMPMTLKEALVGAGALALFCVFMGWRTIRPSAGPSELKGLAGLLIIITVAAFSAFIISPVFEISRGTWAKTSCVALFGYVVHVQAARRDMIRPGVYVMMGASAILCLVSLLQHFEMYLGFVPILEGHRNRIGSFIGHNTGLSVYLAMTLFPTLALLYSPVRRRVRMLALCLTGVIGYILLIAQSRSVWAILLLLVPIFLFRTRRLTGIGFSVRRMAIAGVVALLILATQLIDSPVNVLGVREYPLSRRMYDLSLEQLRTETRLRILVCSAPLIARSPLFGHGLGSFSYVYPEAQAEYYTSHPFMWIAPTKNTTQRAHNDYLQLMIETGLIGTALFLGLIAWLGRRGWLRQKQALEEDTGEAMIRHGVFFSLLVFAIQGALDFPFHIISLSTTAVYLFAAWTGTPGKRPGEDDLAADQKEALELVRPFGGPKAIYGGLTALAAVVMGLGIWLFGSELVANYYRVAANAVRKADEQMAGVISVHERSDILWGAESEAHRVAVEIYPHQMIAHYERGLTMEKAGELLARLSRQSRAAGRQDDATNWGEKAVDALEFAAALGKKSLAEYRTHTVYDLIGGANNKLYQITAKRAYASAAIENFEMAVRYSPAYADPIHKLANLYSNLGLENQKQRIIELRAMIARFDPDFFQEYLVDEMVRHVIEGRGQKAVNSAGALLEVARYNAAHDEKYIPRAREFSQYLVQSLIVVGDLAEAEKEIARALSDYGDPDAWDPIRVHLLAAKGEYAEAAERATELIERQAAGETRRFWEAAAAVLSEAGAVETAPRSIEELRLAGREEPEYFTYIAQVYDEFLQRPEKALEYYEIRSLHHPPAAAPAMRRAADLAERLGRGEMAERFERLAEKPATP